MNHTDPADYLRVLHEPGDVFEIRAPLCPERVGGSFVSTASGYFNDTKKAAAEVERLGRHQPPGIYVTINPVKPDLLARSFNRVKAKAKATTDDRSIARRRWLLLDIDPRRPADVSATEAEMRAAIDLAYTLRTELAAHGWPKPMRMMSGNGCYLLYRVDLPNNDDSADLIQSVLRGLANRFDNDAAEIDQSTFNASRIAKIGGTFARKGDHLEGVEGIEDRPHRQACFAKPVRPLDCVTFEQLQSVGAVAVKENGEATIPTRDTSRQLSGASKFERCVAYMEKMPEAISGQGGHNATLQAACECYRFGLSESEATDAMRWFNNHKTGDDKWSDLELAHKLADARAKVTADGNFDLRSRDGDRPVVLLPGGSVEVGQVARQLGALMAASGRYFNRGGAVVRLVKGEDDTPALEPIKTAGLCSAFETVAALRRRIENKQTSVVSEAAATCSESTARQIQSASAFIDALPPIHTVSPCPVLIERDDKLVAVTDYDRASGVLVTGGDAAELPLGEARELLSGLLSDFMFASSSDRARALAAMVTPALIMGGLLDDRAPLDLGEADASQTGKGYRNRITAAIYGQNVRVVTQRRGNGVGSLEESIGACLISGAGFVSIDNVRGKIDSPAIEALLTEDEYTARAPYLGAVSVKPSRVVLMMTSNRAELTADLANRASIVRLKKQADDFEFTDHPEGDLLAHVRINRAQYLGAVFAVVKAWHSEGKPTEPETAKQHDRRRWAGVLGWIVRHLLGAGDLLDGHRHALARASDSASSWLRDVMLIVKQAGCIGDDLRPADLLDLLHDEGFVDIPGWSDKRNIEDDSDRMFGMRGIGRRMGRLFKTSTTLEIDGLRMTRDESTDTEGRSRHTYRVSEPIPENIGDPPRSSPSCEGLKTKFTGHSPKTPKTDSYSLLEFLNPSTENNGMSSGNCAVLGGGGSTQITTAIMDARKHGVIVPSLPTHLSIDPGEVEVEVQPPRPDGTVRVNGEQRTATTSAHDRKGWTRREIRGRAAELIRDARWRESRGLPGEAVAMRDAWRERLTVCTIDGGLSEEHAEHIALDELEEHALLLGKH